MKKIEKRTEVYVCGGCGAEYENETVCRMCEESHRYTKVELFLILHDMTWDFGINPCIYSSDPKEEEVTMYLDDEMLVEDGLSIDWSIVTKHPETAKQKLKEAALAWLEERKKDMVKLLEGEDKC